MPGTRCSIAGCKNSLEKTKKTNSSIKYHHFPKDDKMRSLWINMCNRSGDWNPQTGFICSEHFKRKDYERDLKSELLNIPSKRKLKPTVPISFMEDLHLEKNDTATTLRQIPSDSISNPSIDNPILHRCANTSAQTEICFSTDHYYDSQQRISDLETQLRTCEKTIKSLKRENETVQIKLKEVASYVNNTLSENERMLNAAKEALTQNQFDLLTKNKKKVAWTADEISKAFTLRYYSKRAYLYLRNTLNYPLPAVSTLQRWATKINMRQGILSDILFMMKIAKDDMTELEKCVVLQFGEMKVQSMHEYDKQQDEIIGPYSYMQVVMARGLFGRWKQPVFIDFDKKMTKTILNKIITALEESGYSVVGCASDCGGGNIGLWKELGVRIKKTYSQHPSTDTRIYFFVDTPHLLKLFRNWLLDTGFILEDGTIVNKEPLKALIEAADTEVNSCCKLTNDHIEAVKTQRQNVTLAAQLLSHTVGTALVHYQPGSDKQLAINTGKFIQVVSAWFDVMYSSIPSASIQSKKPYGMDLEYQISILDRAYHLVSTMRCIGKNGLQLFQKGILMSITSLKLLFDDMKLKFSIKYMLTHRLNQDCLENLFSQIRTKGGLHDHPSPLNALYRVRMIVFGKNLGVIQTHVNVEDSSKDEFIVCKVFEGASVPITEGLIPQPNVEESDNENVSST